MRRADLTGADSMVAAETRQVRYDTGPAMHGKAAWETAGRTQLIRASQWRTDWPRRIPAAELDLL